MEEQDIQQRFHLLQKEIEVTASLMPDAKIDLIAAIDSLRLEIQAIKSFLERYNAEFSVSYPKLKAEATQTVDPEWLAAGTRKKVESAKGNPD
jgi:hypothetical protein